MPQPTDNRCKLISHYEQNDLKDARTIVISSKLDANPIFKGLSSIDEAGI